CMQRFLTPIILKMQWDKINQSVYYIANKVVQEDIESLDNNNDQNYSSQEYSANDLQAMFKQMFYQETENQLSCSLSVQYLSVLGKDLMEKNLTILEQKVNYGKIHGMYKKALSKALQTYSKSEELIDLLQEFVDNSDKSDESDESDHE
ncbi:19907_t:CDS:2, partial [Gigaspora margarita]